MCELEYDDAHSAGTSATTATPTGTHMHIGRLLISLLHAWTLDNDLDRICQTQLGLSRPVRKICYGLLSRAGEV